MGFFFFSNHKETLIGAFKLSSLNVKIHIDIFCFSKFIPSTKKTYQEQ